jgi:hypothetical protein
MKHLEYYNYNYLDKKKIKKELNSDIKNILSSFYLKLIFDYKIIDFDINLNIDYKILEITIFGFGNPIIGEDFKKDDVLLKLIFEKKLNNWIIKIKKSKIFKKIQYRNTETKLENLNLIKNKILNILKNNKNI